MTTRIKSDQDFYVQNEDDLTSSGNTGGATGTATRLANINPDIGYKADSAASTDTGTFSLIALFKRLLQKLTTGIPVTDNSSSLTVDAPVGTPVFVRLSDGTSAIATLPISAASLPLPSGASTAAKQPALGTAGTASADVITIQGIASMTPISITPPQYSTQYRQVGSLPGNVKAAAGTLWNVAVTNLNSSTRYLQIFNSTSVPTGTPLESYPVYGNGGFLVLDQQFFGVNGMSLSTGITLGFSTTALTYTAGTGTDCIVIARYS